MKPTRTTRAGLIAGVAMAVIGLTAGTALAYWSTVGAGTGSATATTINPPLTGNVTLTGVTNAVTVAVSAAPATGAPAWLPRRPDRPDCLERRLLHHRHDRQL